MSTQPATRIAPAGAVDRAPLHIVLVEPEIPPNTGNVARLCAATGCALHLIEPLGFAIDDRALKRAGLDYWAQLDVVMHPNLGSFFAQIAPERCWLLSTRGGQSYRDAPFAAGDALVFGKETKGLPASVLATYAERALRIPMRSPAVRSLNLSTAVGIVAYEALARLGFPQMR